MCDLETTYMDGAVEVAAEPIEVVLVPLAGHVDRDLVIEAVGCPELGACTCKHIL